MHQPLGRALCPLATQPNTHSNAKLERLMAYRRGTSYDLQDPREPHAIHVHNATVVWWRHQWCRGHW
jgi:hypothetical protein